MIFKLKLLCLKYTIPNLTLNKTFYIIIILFSSSSLYSQRQDEIITDVEKTQKKIITWALVQTIPSVNWTNDRNSSNSQIVFGLKWNVTPINISFSTNKYVSPVQFFMVNPMRKFTGSLEFFVQPEYAFSSLEYSGFDKFNVAVGSRVNIPVKNLGEHLYVSLGGKYNFRQNSLYDENGYYGVEGGVYVLFGLLGLTFNYNFNEGSEYAFGINFKYW